MKQEPRSQPLAQWNTELTLWGHVLAFDEARHQIVVDGCPIILAPRAYALVVTLAKQRHLEASQRLGPTVDPSVSHSHLLRETGCVHLASLRKQAWRARRKLRPTGMRICAVRGRDFTGYILMPNHVSPQRESAAPVGEHMAAAEGVAPRSQAAPTVVSGRGRGDLRPEVASVPCHAH